MGSVLTGEGDAERCFSGKQKKNSVIGQNASSSSGGGGVTNKNSTRTYWFQKIKKRTGAPEIKNTKYATSTQYRVFLYFFFFFPVHKMRNKYAKMGFSGAPRTAFFFSPLSSLSLSLVGSWL